MLEKYKDNNYYNSKFGQESRRFSRCWRTTSMEEVKKTNAVMVNPQSQQIEFVPRWDPYAMNMNRGRKYYNYKGFSYITRYCRNQKMVGQERRINYQDNNKDLKEEKSLIVLN